VAAPDKPETITINFESGHEEPRRVRGSRHDDPVSTDFRFLILDFRLETQPVLQSQIENRQSKILPALMAFNQNAQRHVTGSVTLKLYKGNIITASRSSPNSLYDENIAIMKTGGSYNQTDAEGFLRIQGLPGRVQERTTPRSY
jgi:argininosuccinate synthase